MKRNLLKDPPDIAGKILELKWSTFFKEITDRRDPDQLRQVVNSRIAAFREEHPTVNIEFHLLHEDSWIEQFKNVLFKHWNHGMIDHYKNVKDIEAYIEVRNEIVNTLHQENTPQTTLPLQSPVRPIWGEVFASELDFKKFEYLNNNYHNPDKVRWTHIYNALRDVLSSNPLSQRGFFDWVGKTYCGGKLSKRPQPNAVNDPRMERILSNFPSDEELLKNS